MRLKPTSMVCPWPVSSISMSDSVPLWYVDGNVAEERTKQELDTLESFLEFLEEEWEPWYID